LLVRAACLEDNSLRECPEAFRLQAHIPLGTFLFGDDKTRWIEVNSTHNGLVRSGLKDNRPSGVTFRLAVTPYGNID